MLNRGRLAATAGVLFVAFVVWPAHAAAGDGEIPPYRVLIAMPDSEIALRGVVVVRQ